MEPGELPPAGRAWVRAQCDYRFDQDQTCPRLFAPPGATPLLNLPATYLALPDRLRAHLLQVAFCYALTQLFLECCGEGALVAWVARWERLGVCHDALRPDEAAD